MQQKKFGIEGFKSLAFLAWYAVLLVTALMIQPGFAHAAVSPISGTITDEAGRPIENVSVQVKGSNRGITTNAKGQFTLEAEEGATLIVSSAGYISQEVAARASLVIRLKENGKMLEEVYVGYQRLRKSDVTGSISSVKASELNLSSPTISQALVGKVAGVQVSQVSGAPYGGAKIRVRGVGSINASSEPLYVIDGYPVGSNISQGQGNGGNATNGYNPGDFGE